MHPRALTALDAAGYKYAVAIAFMGRVFGFTARRAPGGTAYHIGYTVLSAQSTNPDDDTIWRDFEVLPFPHELRPVGRGLIVLDFKKQPIPAADVPFWVVADDLYIYVFRQSTDATLYADRFVYDEVTGRLMNAWETRFRRSRNYDIPLDAKDTFGSTDMEGNRFLEPTTELTFVSNLQDGRFAVAILPTELANVARWQIFAYDAVTKKINGFSLLRSRSGWFDLRDAFDDDTKTVPPEASYTLEQQGGGALSFESGFGCVLYNRQELLADEYGRSHLQKRALRVMLAVPVGTAGQIAVLDFGIGKDGKVAQVDPKLTIPAVPAIGTGLAFASQAGSTVKTPVPTGAPTGALTFETWINVRGASAEEADFIVRSAANAAVPFAFALDAGIPTFTVGAAKVTVQALDPLDAGYWYHLAAVWDGTAAIVYVNGQPFEEDADALDGTPPATGYQLGGSDGLNGTLDEVRLWSVARTQDEILATMCTTLTQATPGWASLAGYWKCDEPGDATRFTTVANSAGSGASGDGVLWGAQWIATPVPTAASMQPIAWDANGLNVAGTLLTFTATDRAPVLIDGGDSKLHLYLRNRGDGTMLAAHFSTVSARASYSVPWLAPDPLHPDDDQAGVVFFFARYAGAWMNQTGTATKLVTVTPEGAKAKFVTVVLTSTLGLVETWPKVPNTVADFCAVINGEAIQTTDDPAAADEGTIMYDYRKVTVVTSGTQKGPQPAPGIGSSVFSASPDVDPDNGMPAIVQATGSDPLLPGRYRAGLDTWWLYDPPLADLNLSAEGQYVSVLDAARTGTYEGPLEIGGDAAIEAWLRPTPFTANEIATVFVFNKPPAGEGADPSLGTRYMLELDPGGRVICAKGNVIAITERAIAPGEWTHVAGSFRSDYGLQLGGARYLDAGNDVSLSSTAAVTVEAWIRLDEIGGTQTVASKDAPSLGTSWRLYVDGAGKLAFEVNGDTDTGQESRTVSSSSALGVGTWHHVAGVYTIEFVKETAAMFAIGSYAKMPQLTTPPTDSVTVMMWVKTVVMQPGAPIQVLMQSTDPNQNVPFVLFLKNGVPTFTAFVGGAQKSVSAKAMLRSNDWIHLAGRYSASLGIELYVDGQSTGDLTVSAGPAPLFERAAAEVEAAALADFDAAYVVGGMPGQPTQSFIGLINQVSVWNRGLTADQIRQRINRPPSASDPGLAGYWPFQDMFGTTVMDFAGTANGVLAGANWVRIDKGQFAHKVFIDGRLQGFVHVVNPVVPSASTPVMIGSGFFSDYLQGAIGDIRLWKIGRMNWQIQYFAKRGLEANAEGLISNWTLANGKGRVAFDAKGDNNAVIRDAALELSDEAVAKMWLPTTFKAGWTIYVNGQEATSAQGSFDITGYGGAQASIAAISYKGAFGHEYFGEMNELRVWKTQRTAQQVRENMLVGLAGAETGLVGYWPMSDGSSETLADVTGFGANGAWIGFDAPVWQGSTAPVGIELPQIRNVLGGIATPYHVASAYAPAAAQYGAFAPDAYGTLLASYLRAYVYIGPDQNLALFGAFKVGDLDVQYVGQAQMAPTLVGYIEGPPPLPAENLKVYPNSPNAYNGASSISANETGARTLSYTASRDTGFDMNINTKLGVNFETETEAGIGVSTLLWGFIANIGLQATFSLTLGWLAEALISNEIQSTVRKSVEARGTWQPNTYQIDDGFGALWFPNNMGYALVRSGTADVFALRIKGTGALVSYQLRPNPDIPEDVNIIMYKLRPTYVKNGTLDGWIGFQPEKESYKNLTPGNFGSYFKPVQAYALKQLIERERQQDKTYFDNFDAGSVGRRTNAVNFQPGDIGDANNDLANVLMGVRDRNAISSEEWKKKMARRSMVNTYVWTSDGGLYAEDEQFTAVREEQTGGNYNFVGQAGAYTEMKMSAGVSFELDALFGGHIVTQAMKSMNESAGFNLDVSITGESYIGLMKDDPDGGELYTDAPSPGKVRGYRFMTFYLAPSKQNFDEFGAVVDEDWLYRTGPYAGSYDPDALALRQAMSKVNEVWRVLHRVTYVSRTPPQVQDSGQSLAKDVQRPDEESTTNNTWLIADLPPGAPPVPMGAVSREADALLAELAKNPVWGSIVRQNRAGIKQDIMTYMTSYYAVTP